MLVVENYNMAEKFDPTKYGAKPITVTERQSFNPNLYGATPINKVAPEKKETLLSNIKDVAKELPGAMKTIATAPFKYPVKTAQALVSGAGDVGVGLANLGLKIGGSETRLPYLTQAFSEAQKTQKLQDITQALGTGSKMYSGYALGQKAVGGLGVKNPITRGILGDVAGGQLTADADMTAKERGKQALFDVAFAGASEVLPRGIRSALKKKPVVETPITPKIEEPKNLIELGDRKFKVDEPTYNRYKQQEVSTQSKINELTKQTERPDIDQQKLDYFSSQIRKEQSNLDKIKRDITGNYTASELKTLVSKDRKEFAKQGFPDTRTDEQIIDKLVSKRVEYNPDLEVPTPKQDIPTPEQLNVEPTIKKGNIAQQEEVFNTKFNEKGEDYWRDVASKKIDDPDVSPQIAYKQLEQKYDIEGNKEKLYELFQEATEKTSSEQGRGLSYLNSGESSFGPLTSLQHAQGVLDAKLKRMNVNIEPEIKNGVDNVLKDINNGKSITKAIDDFIDTLTCK